MRQPPQMIGSTTNVNIRNFGEKWCVSTLFPEVIKFYSAIENIDGISTRKSGLYPQDFEISIIDQASHSVFSKIG